MASRANQIISDALSKRPSSGFSTGKKRESMTGEEALRVAQQAFNAWEADTAAPLQKDFAKIKEKTEILDGSRTSTVKGRQALRVSDFQALKGFPTLPKSTRAGVTVTADQYNALLDDVKRIYEALGTLAGMLNRKS